MLNVTRFCPQWWGVGTASTSWNFTQPTVTSCYQPARTTVSDFGTSRLADVSSYSVSSLFSGIFTLIYKCLISHQSCSESVQNVTLCEEDFENPVNCRIQSSRFQTALNPIEIYVSNRTLVLRIFRELGYYQFRMYYRGFFLRRSIFCFKYSWSFITMNQVSCFDVYYLSCYSCTF